MLNIKKYMDKITTYDEYKYCLDVIKVFDELIQRRVIECNDEQEQARIELVAYYQEYLEPEVYDCSDDFTYKVLSDELQRFKHLLLTAPKEIIERYNTEQELLLKELPF